MNSSECDAFPFLRHEIAGVPVRELAHRFGTPCFVYDAAAIQRRIEDLRAFDVIRYAQKACSNIAILDLVRRHGVLVDAVSAGELQRALLRRATRQPATRRRSSIPRISSMKRRSSWPSRAGCTSTSALPT